MTVRKKIALPTRLEGEQPAGFRIGPNGEEVMSQAKCLSWKFLNRMNHL